MSTSFFNVKIYEGDIVKFIKNNFFVFLCLGILAFTLFRIDHITDAISNTLEKNPEIVTPMSNNYKKNDDFLYVQNVEDFLPLSYNDLINIFYTITNNGYEKFTFYCPSEYTECLNDIESISKNPEILTNINNFVHPYNSFSNMKTSIAESGEINVSINYLYTKEEINEIEKKVSEIYSSHITSELSDYDKIKVIHDYIIEHAKYDVERNTTGNSNYLSFKAYGPLIEGYATCSGYTDAMAIFLEKMQIKNYKIATELIQEDASGHIWNAVYLDGKWLHLDLTWDDPVSDDGKDYLQHKYFLITTDELEATDNNGEVIVKEHMYNKRIYPEMKKSDV